MTNGNSKTESFKAFVRENSTYMFSLSYRLTGSYEDARDLLQDTWIKAWLNWDEVSGSEKRVPWVRRICVNRYIDSYRRSKKNVPVNDPVFPRMEYQIQRSPLNPENELLADEEVRLIHSQCWTIVSRMLSPYQQIVLVMIDVYRLGVDETAWLIGRSPAATKSLLHRARKAMNDHLGPFCNLLERDNICQCGSWIQFSHDVQKRREYLMRIVSTHTLSERTELSSKRKLIKLLNALPQHVPLSTEIEKIIKNIPADESER